jgi:hypothetical protein
LKRALVATLLIAVAVGCAEKRRIEALPETGPFVATYRAVLEEGGRFRRARIVLWAQMPDRLHAELLGPVGGIRYTLDAGSGRACLVDASRGAAYVGGAGPEAVEVIAGVRLSVPEAVAALLEGRSREGLDVRRAGAERGALPRELRVVAGMRTLTLTRVGLARSRPSRAIGTGEPPANLPVRPLAELAGEEPTP